MSMAIRFCHLLYRLCIFVSITLLSIDSTFAQAIELSLLKTQSAAPFSEQLTWRKIETFEYPVRRFRGSVIFSVHSTKYWDQKALIAPALKSLQEYALRRDISFIYLASQDELKEMTSEQKQKSFAFEGDSHFYQTNDTITFAGGNFTQCLCNAIRASIIHNPGQTQVINIVTDAIYEIPVPSSFDVSLKKKLRPDGQDRNLLSEILDLMNEDQIISYMSSDWLSSETLPCPLYQPAFLEPFSNRRFQYQIRYRGNIIGSIGRPGGKLVTLNLIKVANLR